jgi:preprotein translocase subunit YajC
MKTKKLSYPFKTNKKLLFAVLLVAIFAILSIFLSNKQRSYTNTAYNYKFNYPKSSEISFISGMNGSASISQADTIGVMMSNNNTLRIQVIEKPNTEMSNTPVIQTIQIDRNRLDYVKIQGPCNYLIEGNKIYLCLLTTLTPEELPKNKELFNLLKSITLF